MTPFLWRFQGRPLEVDGAVPLPQELDSSTAGQLTEDFNAMASAWPRPLGYTANAALKQGGYVPEVPFFLCVCVCVCECRGILIVRFSLAFDTIF